MIYKSQFTGAEIDDGINKARQALTATDQNAERIQILEADNANIKTQVGALSVRVDNVENTASTAKTTAESAQSTANTAKTTAESAQSTANTAKTTADSAQSTAQSANSTANNALTATGQNSERIQILEADNENIKTQIGALDVRLDNVEIKTNNIPQFSLVGTTLTITLPA